MTEPTFACPKCSLPFPMSQLHAHYQTCKGPQQQAFQFPQYQNQPVQQQPVYQTPLYVPPAVPEHRHSWFENDTYKVCLDPSCKQIKVKLRGSWQIFVRYGFKLFWIQMIIALAIAFSISSAFGVHR